MNGEFFAADERAAIDRFDRDGYLIFPLESSAVFRSIRERLFQWGLPAIAGQRPPDEQTYFDNLHQYVPASQLNAFRLAVIKRMKQDDRLRQDVFTLARQHLSWLVGNELAMQRACNLSIQMPQDRESLLPLHSDVWDGNSPYEVVFWLPLVDCYRSKSMCMLPRPQTEKVLADFHRYAGLSTEDLFQAIRTQLVWVDVPAGHGLLFSHTLLHGNRINEEDQTRWTFNIRFKSLLSPYGDKELGESFLPITLRPATRIGYSYVQPRVA